MLTSDDLSRLSQLIHEDGWFLALIAYVCRGLVDAALEGVQKELGLGKFNEAVKDAAREGMRRACNCCRAGLEEAAGEKARPPPAQREERTPGVTMEELNYPQRQRNVSWEGTLAKSGRDRCGGAAAAFVRLLLWHLVQPGVYLAALAVYWGDLGAWQQRFGGVVAVREVAYVMATAALTILQPSFLLVEVVASWKEHGGKMWVIMYVLAPEKLVFGWLAWSPKVEGTRWEGIIFNGGFYGSVYTDLCAISALATAVHSGVTPPALMVGYSMTALAGLCTVVLVFKSDRPVA